MLEGADDLVKALVTVEIADWDTAVKPGVTIGDVFGEFPARSIGSVRIEVALLLLSVLVSLCEKKLSVRAQSHKESDGFTVNPPEASLLLAEDRCVPAFDVGSLYALSVAAEIEGNWVVGSDK